jgi:phage/conjugal plasmid C-4 type zinc finger TraR family protein
MDRAYDVEFRERRAALSRITNRLRGRGPIWVDGVPHCRGCGKVIPAKRVDFMPDVENCVACQEELELAEME